jgi:hypothetical protein
MDENRGTTPGGNDASLRVPPHDLHAEQAVLASVLLNNDLINGVISTRGPTGFSTSRWSTSTTAGAPSTSSPCPRS